MALRRSGNDVGVVAPVLASIAQFPIASPLKAISEILGAPEKFTEGGVRTLRSVRLAAPKLRRINRRIWIATGKSLISQYILEHGRPDVIHAHSALYAGILANIAKERYRIPYVLTEHSSAVIGNKIPEWQWPDLRVAIGGAAHRIAVGGTLADALRGMDFIQEKNWTIIPNLLGEDFLCDPEDILPPMNPCPFTFLAAGGLIHRKAFDILIDAVATCLQNFPVKVLIAGDGPERRSLESRIRKLGVDSKVDLLGNLSRKDLRDKMKECNAFVLPSRAETFGVVLIEAMAMGKPVIATRCGGPQDIVLENTGVLVPIEDSISLGTAMARLASGEIRFDSLEIHKACTERFSGPSVAKSLERIYREVLAEQV